MASVIPMDKGINHGGYNNVNGSNGSSSSGHSGEFIAEDSFLGHCSREWLARGCQLLKRTRKGKNANLLIESYFFFNFFLSNVMVLAGDLHWKMVSVYINRLNQVR